jgi:exopolysaccharide biosynthesis protein
MKCNLSLHCRPDIKSEELPQPKDWLVRMKRMIYWRQLFVILALIAFSIVIAVVSSAPWAAYYHNKQEQKISELNQLISQLNQTISEVQSQFAQQQAEPWDGQPPRQCEGNATARISELEDNTRRQGEELKTAIFNLTPFP